MPRFNPLPFAFAPGAALVGWFVAGGWGAFIGFVCWFVVIGLATAWVLNRKGAQEQSPPSDFSEVPPSHSPHPASSRRSHRPGE